MRGAGIMIRGAGINVTLPQRRAWTAFLRLMTSRKDATPRTLFEDAPRWARSQTAGSGPSGRIEEHGRADTKVPRQGLDVLAGQVTFTIEDQRQDRLADPGTANHIGLADSFLFHKG